MGPTDRVIVLIDMDCFYCQVEEKLNPDLDGKPIAVVQYNAWQGGGIIAVNYPARDEGVTRHMRGNEARKKCPNIRLVQVPELRGKADLTKYRDAGKCVADVLATFTPLLQRASVDEAYLDITEAVENRIKTNFSDLTVENLPSTYIVGCDLKDFVENVITNKEFSVDNLKLAVGGLIAEEIRNEVFKQTRYKCSAGIAHNKVLAKLVCSLHKPNKQTILPQDAVEEFFETMPIGKIKNLGGKFGQSLSDDFHITYMGQLAKISEKDLAHKYDEKMAHWLYNVARGIDTEPVTTKLMSKSIASCKNFPGRTALTTSESVEHWLNELANELSERLGKDLQENNRKAKQIVVSFAQDINKKDVSRSRTCPLTSYEAKRIVQAAFEIIKKNCLRSDGGYCIKFLGLSAGHFEDIKKVREITTFFQVKAAKNNENSDKKYTDEACDIYNLPTQPLEENIDDLIFYDNSFRIKENVLLQENSDANMSSRSIEAITAENCNNTDSKTCLPSASFFASYFHNETSNDCTGVIKEQSPMEDKENNEGGDFIEMDTNEELTEICNDCQQNIPISEIVAHQDFHFALKLSKSDAISQRAHIKTASVDDKKKRPKSVKRKADCNNTLMLFLTKDQEPAGATETCIECNKKISIEEISSHMDYHMAKKLHKEINSVQSSVTTKKKLPKKQTAKGKNQGTANKSVTSFFQHV